MEDEFSCFYMDKIVQKNPDIHSELILPNIYNGKYYILEIIFFYLMKILRTKYRRHIERKFY